jgi:hypothetical protein|tara:strand:+ start:5581 stop:5955 length:375 start_codon:yes stop_codon:yes gene_type:complete
MSSSKEEPVKKKKRGNPALYKGMPPLNPNGRTKGSLNKFTKLSRELMSNKGPEIVQKVIDMALEGDRHCLKMCMDRIIPTSKAVEITHDHQDLGINIIVEGVKAIEREEEEDYKTIEAEYTEEK